MPRTLSFNSVRKKFSKKQKIALLVAVVVAVMSAVAVTAHQSPGSCNSNRFNISITKDKTEVKQGDILTYTVTASNLNSGSDLACDITGADITLRLPAADGTPTGTLVTIATNQNFPGNTPVTTLGTAQYTVNVNPGVIDIVAEGRAEGVLHDAPTDHSAQIVKTLGTSVIEDEEEPEAPPEEPETPPSSPEETPSSGPTRASK